MILYTEMHHKALTYHQISVAAYVCVCVCVCARARSLFLAHPYVFPTNIGFLGIGIGLQIFKNSTSASALKNDIGASLCSIYTVYPQMLMVMK